MGNVKSAQVSGKLQTNSSATFDYKSEKQENAPSLNDRIVSMTEALVENSKSLAQVDAFFKKELKEINASTGNKEIQKSLIRLKDKLNEKFETKESHALAFQIQCTARAMTPDVEQAFTLEHMPVELHQFFVDKMGANAFNDLLVSKSTAKKLSVAKNEWINANHISLKELGCNSARMLCNMSKSIT